MADVPEQLGFYERMLPQREQPLDALGGILNGLGAGFGILALIWWPLFLGGCRDRARRDEPRVRARARDAEPLRLGLRDRRPRLADRHDARRVRPQAAQSLMAVAERATAWDVFEQFERDVCQLGRVGGLLDWDEQVNMPPRGAAARGEAKATLAGVLHERICDERFGEAISELGDDARPRRFRARPRARGAARARSRRAGPCLARARARAGRVRGLRGLAGRARRSRLLALPRSARAPRLAAPRGGRRRRLRGRRALRRAARPVRARHARGPAGAAAARPARRARAVRAGDRSAAPARRRVRAPHVRHADAARRRRPPGGRDRLRLRAPGAWTRRRTPSRRASRRATCA